MDLEQQGLSALRRLEVELTGPAAAAGLDRAQLCQKYHSLKPALLTMLALLAKFPLIGKGVIAAVRFLMQLADQLCPGAAGVEPGLAVTEPGIAAAPGPGTLAPQPISPGHERWSVKTGADSEAAGVANTFPVSTTVEALRDEPRPSEFPAPTEPFSVASGHLADQRAHPVETTIWTVDAQISAFKLETDGDYHLVIEGTSSNTMIAEIPKPDPDFVAPSSPWGSQIAAVRQAFQSQFGLSEAEFSDVQFTEVNQRARITGVGFFDFDHGQRGRAPNVIELHPVINIEFL